MNPIVLRRLPDEQREDLRKQMILLAQRDPDEFARNEEFARELLALAPEGREEEWYWAGLLRGSGEVGDACRIGELVSAGQDELA